MRLPRRLVRAIVALGLLVPAIYLVRASLAEDHNQLDGLAKVHGSGQTSGELEVPLLTASDDRRHSIQPELATVREVLESGESVPFVGAIVSVVWGAGGADGLESVELESGHAGRVFFDAPAGAVVTARASGYSGASARVNVGGKAPELNLRAHGSLQLTVLSAAGRPRAGVEVALVYGPELRSALSRLQPQERPAQDFVKARTDDDGRVKIRPILAGIPLKVEVIDPLYGRHHQQIAPLQSAEHRVDSAQLPEGGAAILVVQDQFGRGLPGAVVTAFLQEDSHWIAASKAVTQEHGVALLPGLAAGEYKFVANGWNPSSTSLYLLETSSSIVTSETTDLGELRAAEPFIEGHLTVDGGEDGGRLARAYISRSGTFGMPGEAGYDDGLGLHKCLLPVGRPFQVWVTGQGQWRFSMQVLRPNSQVLDPSVGPEVSIVSAPGSLRVDFKTREVTPAGVVSGWVSEEHEESASQSGFLALLNAQGVVVSLLSGVDLTSTCYFSLTSTYAGNHRLVGCLGGRVVDEELELRTGDVVQLQGLRTRVATPVQVELQWPGGGVRKGSLSAQLPAEVGTGELVEVCSRTISDGTSSLWLPPSLPFVMRFDGEEGTVGWGSLTVHEQPAGVHTVILASEPPG